MKALQSWESKMLPMSKIKQNIGQVDGLPKNPRFIKTAKYEQLKNSIKDFPDYLGGKEIQVFEYNGEFVIIAGNMRARAAKELGIKTLPCKIIPSDIGIDRLKEIAIKDNLTYGQFDFEYLANDWEQESIAFGVDGIEQFQESDEEDLTPIDNTIKAAKLQATDFGDEEPEEEEKEEKKDLSDNDFVKIDYLVTVKGKRLLTEVLQSVRTKNDCQTFTALEIIFEHYKNTVNGK